MRPADVHPTVPVGGLLLKAAIVVFLATRLFILFGLTPLASDLSVYFANVVRATSLHQTPYSKDLMIEFPPLAWWTMAAVGKMQGPVDPAGDIERQRRTYMQSFRQLMAVCDVVAFGLLVALVKRRRPDSTGIAAVMYVTATACLAHVLYDRLDMAVLMFILTSAYCWLRAAEPGASSRWSVAAYGLAGLGANLKVVPGLILPFFLLADVRSPASPERRPVFGLAGALAGLGLPFAIQYWLSGPGVLDMFTFHAGRGIQVESTFASLMSIGSAFGRPASISLWEGGADLAGPGAASLKWLATVCVAVWLAALVYWTAFRGTRTHARIHGYQLGLLAIAGAVALSRVLSPQYFVWALPLIVIVVIEAYPARSLGRRASLIAVLAIAALTTWVFPYHFFGFTPTPLGLEVGTANLSEPSNATFTLLAIRNFLYLTVVAVATVGLWHPPPLTGSPVTTADRPVRSARRRVKC